jgi:pimeloyl-ACP methyl ester carboxylesterase
MLDSNQQPIAHSDTNSKKVKQRPIPIILKLLRLAFSFGGYIAPRLAGLGAYKLWFKPTRFQTPVSEQAVLKRADIKHIKINDHNIVTYAWGTSGPLVLLVHGWSGRGTQLGSFVEPLIKEGYRILSFDAPAHGKSSGKQTNLYEVADVIVSLQERYGNFESVITHSFGGPCLAVAIQRGLKTSRVINISPPATTKGLVEKFIDTLHIPEKAGKNLMDRIEETFGKKIWHEISMENTVKGLTIPALVIHDEHDVDVPWQEGQLVALSCKKDHFLKTTGLGHRRILRDTSVIESTVNFIAVAA